MDVQRTSVSFRLAAHTLVLAFVALMLVVIGCTEAQAAAVQQIPAAASISSETPAGPVTADTTSAPAVMLELVTASKVNTACVPGRDSARVEKRSLAPSPALLPHSPVNDAGYLAGHTSIGDGGATHLGRIPAALTHLDLGIVRT